MPMWLCRAGRYGEFENKFLEDGKVYCTWDNQIKPRRIKSSIQKSLEVDLTRRVGMIASRKKAQSYQGFFAMSARCDNKMATLFE